MRKYQNIDKTEDDILPHVVQQLWAALSALFVGGLTSQWIVPLAYTQRGYSAIGGEWMFTLAVSFAVFQVCKWLLEKI